MLGIALIAACDHGPWAGQQIGEESTTTEPDTRGRLRVLSGARVMTGEGLQAAIFDLRGANGDDALGGGLTVLGDVDGDGLEDLAFQAGRDVRLLQGAEIAAGVSDAAALRVIGTQSLIVAAGDLTGDGLPDVALSSQDLTEVYSGAGLASGDLPVASIVTGTVWTASYADAAGDVDGDGVADLLVPRYRELPPTGTEPSTDSTQAVLLGPFVGERYVDDADAVVDVPDLEGMGDLDGDGLGDFAGQWDDNETGPRTSTDILVYSGADVVTMGTTGREDTIGVITGDTFGTYLLPGGDLDGDGLAEVWVNVRVDAPHLRVFRGGDLADREYTSADLSFAGDYPNTPALADLDGDGSREVILRGAWQDESHVAVEVYAGVSLDGRTLTPGDAAHVWPMARGKGVLLAAMGDMDGDGADELLIAEPGAFATTAP